MDINKVILVGHVGKDPEGRTLESGTSFTTFSLATTEKYKNKGGEVQEKTEWHNVVCWRSTADFAAKYISKGDYVYVEGKLTIRSYDDKEGNKRYVTEIVADTVSIMSKKRTETVVDEVTEPPDDLPF